MAEIFSTDPYAARRTLWHEDPDGRIVVETQQDVEDVIVAAKDRSNHDKYAFLKWQGDFHQIATIPMPILMELHRRGITTDDKAYAKWLNDPDNRKFRSKLGRV
jgi:hypothetical protein